MSARTEIASASAEDSVIPPLLACGLDSLYVSYYLDTATSPLDWDDLAYRKQRARTEAREFSEFELGSESFALMPYGAKPYTFILTNRAFEIRLAERLQPSCYVRFFSEALWSFGLDDVEQRFRRWSTSVGLVWLRPECISRADWAFDYHLPDVDFTAECFVSRATKDATHREHGRPQTIRLGQGDVVIRVYDKSAEIEQASGKAWFHDLWGRATEVWRVEFQVRSDRLKEAGIGTLADLRACQYDLLRELAQSHTTLRLRSQDSNRSRWPLHPLWRKLLMDIATLPQTGLVRAFDPERALRWRMRKQCQSLYGNLKGLAAVESLLNQRREPVSLGRLLEMLPDLLAFEHSDVLWRTDVGNRMTAHRYGKW